MAEKPLLPNPHSNVDEHKYKFFTFLFSCIITGLLGVIAGGSIQKVMSYIIPNQEIPNDQWKVFAYLVLQLLFISVFFFVLFHVITLNNILGPITFDDWISGSFQGIFFSLTFFSAQTAFPLYAQKLFSFSI